MDLQYMHMYIMAFVYRMLKKNKKGASVIITKDLR